MNKSARMDLTISKPSSKQLAKIKDKLRSQDQKLRQYESMCETEEGKLSHSIIPFHKKASKKDLRHANSPARLTRSKSKTLDRSIKKHSQDKPEKKAAIGEVYSQLMAVKSEYNTLKQSYNKLVVQKNEVTSREQSEKEAIQLQLQMRCKQLQKCQRMAHSYEQQIERIKKECYKLLQNERLKNKKLEQTIQQKDLMIAYLRNQNDKQKRAESSTLSSINQSCLYTNHFSFQSDNPRATLHSSLMSNVIVEEISLPQRAKAEEDSLSFSRDKSKQMESIYSFLTAQDQSVHLNLATKKDIVIVDTHSSGAETENDQCPTFEHRGQEECEDGLRNSAKPIKASVISDKGKKNASNLPPKNLSKIKCVDLHKKERLQTDQNCYSDLNKKQLAQGKKFMNSSLSSRKKNSSKKKKV